ncbi:unnamed protein product [Vitrella brassicaformis CCMP3155]|uniref:Serine/threonine-protein phosphatase 2A activator n=2 Tax=Vitrella brassicaformis TaxID=1169539 RepID=A0A0G4FDB1_VITBC|nr:unnamed protein product [Vitrella brassicaformis CCMP3155]|mmetsp:Transcript_27099/g.77941  ORF Transcript_27099/g.77941 Transcript_27099/m.77941 type:complete len:394 (-) Transcript_27099:1655-2836(-)|eukprot:CEM10805.1 unnamed protein product [Vitrella brassicaformis CCMP3155]
MSAAPAAAAPTEFVTPRKRISNESDLNAFLQSETYQRLMGFVTEMGTAVRGYPIVKGMQFSERVAKVKHMLQTLRGWIDEFPPIQQPMRFGNKAFQQWHDRLIERVEDLLKEMLPAESHGAIVELTPYLLDSFGNRTRIDYGTGHEAAFLAFLYCLWHIQYFTQNDKRNIVLVAFTEYIELMRALQTAYMLEPAGSRGVWGLDDYHFLPFLWGSAQLMIQEEIEPSQALDRTIVADYADQYLYINAIKAIQEMKKGVPFGECAPLLNDITAVPTWKKVNSGLMKMYQAEVWSKVPVIQHFYFGNILPFPNDAAAAAAAASGSLPTGTAAPGHTSTHGNDHLPSRRPMVPPMGPTMHPSAMGLSPSAFPEGLGMGMGGQGGDGDSSYEEVPKSD